jgi:hypothetical protein
MSVETKISSLVTVRSTRKAMYIEINTEKRSCNHCCSGRTISITYSECVFLASVIQHPERMRHIVLSSVESLAVQYFAHYLIKGMIFGRRKKLLNIKCVF